MDISICSGSITLCCVHGRWVMCWAWFVPWWLLAHLVLHGPHAGNHAVFCLPCQVITRVAHHQLMDRPKNCCCCLAAPGFFTMAIWWLIAVVGIGMDLGVFFYFVSSCVVACSAPFLIESHLVHQNVMKFTTPRDLDQVDCHCWLSFAIAFPYSQECMCSLCCIHLQHDVASTSVLRLAMCHDPGIVKMTSCCQICELSLNKPRHGLMIREWEGKVGGRRGP